MHTAWFASIASATASYFGADRDWRNFARRATRASTLALCSALLSACGGDDSCIRDVPCGSVPHYDENQPAKVQTTQRFASSGLGNWHSCMLDTTGAAWCWGSNENGQLGAKSSLLCNDDTIACSSQPLTVDGGHVFVSVVASHNHTCALTADGQAWCWGFGLGGQLGDGLRSNSQSPVSVAGGHRFIQIAASLWQGVTCGLKADGTLWCWGVGFSGAAGPAGSSVPTLWTQAGTVALRSISLGEAHACGLDAAGQAWCWGRNWFGEIGDGSGAFAAAPVPVAGGRSYRQLAVGPMHSCALDQGGQAWCWGITAAGDGGSMSSVRLAPVAVAGGLGLTQIASGQARSCGLTADGSAWCWGSGTNGGLGDGNSIDRSAPVAVTGGLGFASIAVGGMATCGLTGDGTAYCWGTNNTGALGKPIVAH
ncbi:MAG TPA: hypothetical protein VLW55_26285 [Burkholderiaceae bacterium]|nr:hypothetical protein [Burkholderiaceae bacterium]